VVPEIFYLIAVGIAANKVYFSSVRVHKSWVPGCLGNYILYVGAWNLWVLSL